MSKDLHVATIVVSSFIALTSCVNKDYKLLDKIDLNIGAEMSILGPGAHSNIKLYEPLPDSLNSFRFRVEGDEVYFSKTDTQHIGNDIIEHLKMCPQGEFTHTSTIERYDEDPRKGIVDDDLEYEFPDINTNPEERLDSILVKDNQILEVFISSTIQPKSGSYLELTGDLDKISLNPELYPDNKIRFDIDESTKSVKIDISRAMIRFEGGKKFNFHVDGVFYTSNDITPGSTVTFDTSIKDLKPRCTFGYIGPDIIMYETTKTVNFGYIDDLQGDNLFLPFYNPIIKVISNNSIGIPAEYEIDYVKLYNSETGEAVYAEFNGSYSTKFVLNYPTPSEIEGLSRAQLISLDVKSIEKNTSFVLDREYGHTDRMFQIRGDKLEYHYRIRPLHIAGKNIAYFFDESCMDLMMDAEFNARFAGNPDDPDKNFYISRTDSIKINFQGIKIDEEKIGLKLGDDLIARVKIDFVNHLPVDGVAEYSFYDTLQHVILPEKAGTVVLSAAPSDKYGAVVAPSVEQNVYVKLNYAEFKQLTDKGGGMVVNYRVENKELKDIWLKSNDWIDLILEVWAKGFVSYNFNKEDGK